MPSFCNSNGQERRQQHQHTTHRSNSQRWHNVYSIDVLSDGSESHSGANPTLFLSVYRRSNRAAAAKGDDQRITPTHHELLNNTDEHHLLSRYALTGVGDCISRAAADQRFKLGLVKAVFGCSSARSSSSSVSNDGCCDCMVGLVSLVLALREAGAASLAVVAAPDITATVDSWMETLFPRKQYPTVQLCQLPSPPSANNLEDLPANGVPSWWNVYNDDQILVHASYGAALDSGGSFTNQRNQQLLFLYSLLPGNCNDDTPYFSFLVVPSLRMVTTSLLHHLPELESDQTGPGTKSVSLRCEFVIALQMDPKGESPDPNFPPCYFLEPSSRDDALLTRAQAQSAMFHQLLPAYFPYNNINVDNNNHDDDDDGNTNPSMYQLTTRSQVIWRQHPQQDSGSLDTFSGWTKPFMHRPSLDKLQRSCNPIEGNVEKQRRTLVTHLQTFLEESRSIRKTEVQHQDDENEIDLDIDEEVDEAGNVSEEAGSTPEPPFALSSSSFAQLLVLGTGCASPSPVRGASGYVILGDTDHQKESSALAHSKRWAIALEAGEGFVTQWRRHAQPRASGSDLNGISDISAIWISHAHWDHFGGLVPLLLAIASERKALREFHKQNESEPERKRHRVEPASLNVPFVFAPRKVLHFLRGMWPERIQQEAYFRGVAHEDHSERHRHAWHDWNAQFSSPPVAFWENVLVDHSCRSSFGCIFGLLGQGTSSRPHVVAFSGDTRPSERFVQACRQLSQPYCLGHVYNQSEVDLLIHEATFDETERAMSLQKKHSTIREALDIGRQVSARRLLLTHFSQRYNNFDQCIPEIPPIVLQNAHCERRRRACMAFDGMLVPLYSSETL